MCIRDSVKGNPSVLVMYLPTWWLLVPGSMGFVAVTGAITAVSYTHLRAHETVLDLVCRLLLEKKKTQLSTQRSVHALGNSRQNTMTTTEAIHAIEFT